MFKNLIGVRNTVLVLTLGLASFTPRAAAQFDGCVGPDNSYCVTCCTNGCCETCCPFGCWFQGC